ncbi:MAG: NAD(P)H-hydrate dehydratase [Thermovirgaceae bacterium]|nr:NAD(P)H-hydrate dehydratase [Thermovirgaceae bacterium]
MFLYDSEEIREAERVAISEFGIPGILLMENAGRAASDVIAGRFPSAKLILVACGPGNNGGDGFVAARHFLRRSLSVKVLLSTSPEKITGDALFNLQVLQRMGTDILVSRDLSDEGLKSLMDTHDIVVDALLGSGSKGAPRGEISRIVAAIRGSVHVVSLDIPTGVDPSTGRVEGEAVRADLTVTMLARKTGLEIMPGRAFRGDIETVDIGVRAEVLLRSNPVCSLVEGDEVAAMLPTRGPDIHKGNRGLVLVVGGSSRYAGAPILSALGALRCGAGGVVVAAPAQTSSHSGYFPEIIFMEGISEDGFLSSETWDIILEKWGGRIDSVIIGPGLDRGQPAQDLFRRVWREWPGPLCVDGDALFALGRWTGRPSREHKSVITPHEGEAAALLSRERHSVSGSRLQSVLDLANLYDTTLLKGPASIVSDGTCVRVIPFVVPGLSVPGSGDVLSGAIGALLGMGLDAVDAATAGAYLHALAGRELEKEIGRDGIIATEIASAIPRAISLVGSGNGEWQC